MKKELTASVVICTRNRCSDLVICLNSLAQQTYTHFELIIVDSSDVPVCKDPFFIQAIHVFKAGYTYVRSMPGLTLQRNKGIGLARGDIVYFFDDDVILEPSYLENMQTVFVHQEQYLGGMGTITNMQPKDVNLWRALRKCFLLSRDYADGFFTYSGMPTHAYGTQYFKEVQVLGGCCMAFRADVLKKHRFDEKLTRYAYMEDCDISWRVAQDGPLFYNPGARLVHNNSPIARDTAITNRAMFLRNYRYLYFKNVYPRSKLSLLTHWWTLCGLFVYALLIRDIDSIKGYAQALWVHR